jgi:hypothetical protein
VDPSYRAIGGVTVNVTLPWSLGIAWGVLAACPVAARARRATVTGRIVGAARTARGSSAATRCSAIRTRIQAWLLPAAGPVARVVRDIGARRSARVSDRLLAHEQPVALDLLGVAVDAGCTPYLAAQTAARWGPPLIAERFTIALRECALGTSFERSLADLAGSTPALRPMADALLTSDRLGAPVGPALARLAAEERTALRRAAEAHARKVPVRLLFPLVFLVLPAFVLLTVVPGLASGLARL